MAMDCQACENLKEHSANLIVNGLGDAECSSLQNDTGLNPTTGNNDCTDLKDLNDCLIGNMDEEIETQEVCDWKPFTKRLIANMWTVYEALICAVCGLWTNVHSLWAKVSTLETKISALESRMATIEAGFASVWDNITNLWNSITSFNTDISKLYCYINYLFDGSNVSALLDESDFVAGTGVDFDRDGPYISRPTLRVNGSTYTVTGSINIDLDNNHWGRLGLTNTGNRVQWGSGASDYNRINTPNGNYTICYIKIKKSKFPSLKDLETTVGGFTNGGTGDITINSYDGDQGQDMTGQWGRDSADVNVPAGWIYVRVSLASLVTWGIQYSAPGDEDRTASVTFRATGLARTNQSGVVC